MKKSEFISLVREEIETIKAKATQEEIGRLDFSRFAHTSVYRCIYGLMTGDCNSERARELMPKTFDDIASWKESDYIPFPRQKMEKGYDFTALEKYLYMVKAPMHEKIMQYLKGEISEIELT